MGIDRASLPEGHPAIAASLNNLANLYVNQKRLNEAEPLFIEALRIWKASLPEGHPRISGSLNNLASLYADQNRFSEAKILVDELDAMRLKH
jgi:tetratricopeptide (TPR) repeat protein